MSNIESVILSNLLLNENYSRKVVPYLKEEYFHDAGQKVVYQLIDSHITKYNSCPSKQELKIELQSKNLNEHNFKSSMEVVQNLDLTAIENEEWLLENTEKFCKDKAIYNALLKSIEIVNDPSGQLSKEGIPDILKDALSVSFDTHVGHNWADDAEYRWEFYHNLEKKLPFDLYWLNKITSGGISPKTLTLGMAATGAGKSLMMCHMAAAHMAMGFNVLYITMEMAEERISERIDANLLNIDIKKVPKLDKETYLSMVEKVKKKNKGQIIVKEYPNGSAGSAHFRYLINELKLKKNFHPDVLYVDYLNICQSSRLRRSNTGSYDYIKSIAEELRSLGQEFNIPVVTMTQTNRDGLDASDLSMSNISESVGTTFTADLMFAFLQTPELEESGEYLYIQLKNRYNDKGDPPKFLIGVDKSKMRLYDLDADSKMETEEQQVMTKTRPKNFGDFT